MVSGSGQQESGRMTVQDREGSGGEPGMVTSQGQGTPSSGGHLCREGTGPGS